MSEQPYIPTCKCGGDLTPIVAKLCYNGNRITCDVCQRALEDDEIVFHCPNRNMLVHMNGFDICENCVKDDNIPYGHHGRMNTDEQTNALLQASLLDSIKEAQYLTTEQRSRVLMLTDMADCDAQTAINYLQISRWNFEDAIQLFLSDKDARENQSEEQQPPSEQEEEIAPPAELHGRRPSLPIQEDEDAKHDSLEDDGIGSNQVVANESAPRYDRIGTADQAAISRALSEMDRNDDVPPAHHVEIANRQPGQHNRASTREQIMIAKSESLREAPINALDDVAELRRRCAQFEAAHKDAEDELKQVKEQLAQLQEELTQREREVDGRDDTIQFLRDENAKILKKSQENEAQFQNELELQRKEFDKRHEETQAECQETLKVERTAFSNELFILSASKSKLAEHTSAEIETLRRTLSTLSRESSTLIERYKQKEAEAAEREARRWW